MKELFSACLLLLALSACNNDKVEQTPDVQTMMKVTLQPTYGSTDLQLDQTQITPEGYLIQFTDIRGYFTEVKNGSSELCRAALYDYRQTGTTIFNRPGLPADYPSLQMYVGVGPDYNHLDPSAFPNDNPLNIAIANDMHWDWNPGYIFIKVEAKVDTLPADGIDNFDHFVIFHIGTDPMLQTLQLAGYSWSDLGGGQYHLPLKIDMLKFLDNGTQSIDVKTEHSSHTAAGQEALSLKVIQNFKDAIGLY